MAHFRVYSEEIRKVEISEKILYRVVLNRKLTRKMMFSDCMEFQRNFKTKFRTN